MACPSWTSRTNSMVAVLCARRDSIYHGFKDLDVYDAGRDAFSFRGGVPVVCHPPCRGWGRFRWRSNHDENELELARFCVRACQANGGVLEHPAASALWKDAGLPRPGQPPSRSGWTLAVDQSWWGHPARKATWLYIVGLTDLPTIPYSLTLPPTPVVHLGRAERERTPPTFAEWLVLCAKLIGRGAGT